MRHHRWSPYLILFLSWAGTLVAEPLPLKGVISTHARIISPFSPSGSTGTSVTRMPEVTTAVFGPQENTTSCPDGRLVFGSGGIVGVSGLAGENPQAQNLGALLTQDGEPQLHITADNHLVRVGNDLVYSVMGVTWKNLPCLAAQPPTCKKPDWWDFFDEYPAKKSNMPGARGAIWVFRSSDCGSTWSLTGKIDAATLTVKDPAGNSTPGFCGVPRRWETLACAADEDDKKTDDLDLQECPRSNQQKVRKHAEVGGWDGHYLAVDPESGRMVISTLCAFGKGISRKAAHDEKDLFKGDVNLDMRHHIFIVSDDDGKSWHSKASLPPQPSVEEPRLGAWRSPVMPLDFDRWAFAYGRKGKVKLLIDDPLNGSFSKDTAIEVTDYQAATTKEPLPWSLDTHHFVVGWDLALNRVPIGSASGPGGLKQPFFKPLVQVSSFTWEEGKVLRLRVHSVDTETGSSQVLTSPIRSDVTGESVTQGSFIQGERASLFYWLEELENDKFRVRYQVYSQGKPLLKGGLFQSQKPGVIKDAGATAGATVDHKFTGLGTGDDAPFQGDYVKGAHYLGEKGTEHFFLVWNENGKVAFAEVKAIGLTDDPPK